VSEGEALPKALSDALTALSDQDFAARIRKICQIAARTIGRLRDVDLLKYERYVATGAPDLSLWEEVAPVIRDTVMDVNAVLNAVRESFAMPPGGDAPNTVGQAIEEVLGPEYDSRTPLERRKEEVVTRIHHLCAALAADVTNLGDRVRRPEVVADRWNLLTDLQDFRYRFRKNIGDLVYAMASPFSLASKAALVPWYAEEVLQAVALRRAATDLHRVMGTFARRAAQCADDEMVPLTQQLAKDLDRFGRFKAYSLLRAQDKQRIVEFRHYLERLRTAVVPGIARVAIDDFAKFTGSLSRINEREILVSHDRESMAQVAVRLESAELALDSDLSGAIAALDEAVSVAQGLYGRDGRLDDFLRMAATQSAPRSAPEARKMIAELRRLFVEIGAV
jgi:hypothetical protein